KPSPNFHGTVTRPLRLSAVRCATQGGPPMHVAADALPTGSFVFLVLAVLFALSFEFVNGFHDTANAVATVIYTHTLKPWVAVIWSGSWNFIGVFFGGITVAMGIVNLLPVETLVDQNIAHRISMVLEL